MSRDDCFDIPSSFCGNKKNLYITHKNEEDSLIAHYTFDEEGVHDGTGNFHEGYGEYSIGPSSHIKGYSAYLNGNQTITIPHHEQFLDMAGLTITFWIYLLEDSTGNWRTIMHKGENYKQLTPTIMLWPNERKLHVRASTQMYWNEGIESKGTLNLKSWTHISIIFSGQMMQLYINGQLDNQAILQGQIIFNKGDWHIGKDPWHQGVKCYLDEIKIYNEPMVQREFEAETAKSAPLTGTKYVTLGCESCNFIEGLNSCSNDYHMCSYAELYSGAYMMARKNGWFKFNTDIWTRQTSAELEKNKESNEIGNPVIMKMTLCCKNK